MSEEVDHLAGLPDYEREYALMWWNLPNGDYGDNVVALRKYQQYISQNFGSPELRRILDKWGDT